VASPSRATPVSLSLRAQVETTLRKITRANGYNHDFTPASFHDQAFDAFQSKVLPACGVIIGPELADPEATVTAKSGRILTVQIDWWLNKKGFPSLLEANERMAADLVVAMLADVKRGGLAWDTRLQDIVRVEAETGVIERGGSAFFDVHFRYAVGAPTVIAA